jgi:hypothetical protein
MPRTVRKYRRVPERHDKNSDLVWWISGTLVLTLLVALVVYGVTRPNLTTINTQPTPIAPQTNTVGQAPKSDDRVQNPVGAPGTNQ